MPALWIPPSWAQYHWNRAPFARATKYKNVKIETPGDASTNHFILPECLSFPVRYPTVRDHIGGLSHVEPLKPSGYEVRVRGTYPKKCGLFELTGIQLI